MKDDLQGFEKAQNLAYEATSAVHKHLCAGMTEKEAASLIYTYLRDSGVKSFFHKPFVWFGDRTRFNNIQNSFDFLPKKRCLIEGDVVILDVAPILDGYVADVGHTLIFGTHHDQEPLRAKQLLLSLRENLPKWFESPMTAGQIWEKVDSEITENGFDNVHQKYPFSVLGHRVHRVPFGKLPGLAPFGWHSLLSLATHGIFPDLLDRKHKGSKVGIWAIEPHLGGKDFGAKFEELLVVKESSDGKIKAHWLSNQVPHLKPDWMNV